MPPTQINEQELLKELISDYLGELGSHTDKLEERAMEIEEDPSNEDAYKSLYRAIHTLKGNSSIIGQSKLTLIFQKVETILSDSHDNRAKLSNNMQVIMKLTDLLREIEGEQGFNPVTMDIFLDKIKNL